MQKKEWNLIDFHAKFTEEYMQWCLQHQQQLSQDEADTDDLYYEMYAEWLDQPKDWLNGASPRSYFADMREAPMLVSAFMEYILQEMEVPDPLIERLVQEKDAVYPIFLNILMEQSCSQEDISEEELLEVRAQIIPLLGEMHKPHPYIRYIQLLQEQQEDTALAEELTEALMEVCTAYMPQLKEAYDNAMGYAKLAILDLFSRMKGAEEAYDLLVDELNRPGADIAFLANCLGRLGDARAVEALKELLYRPEIQYYEFKEVKNAIEELSGEEIEEMDFSGDPLYDYLKGEHESE